MGMETTLSFGMRLAKYVVYAPYEKAPTSARASPSKGKVPKIVMKRKR